MSDCSCLQDADYCGHHLLDELPSSPVEGKIYYLKDGDHVAGHMCLDDKWEQITGCGKDAMDTIWQKARELRANNKALKEELERSREREIRWRSV